MNPMSSKTWMIKETISGVTGTLLWTRNVSIFSQMEASDKTEFLGLLFFLNMLTKDNSWMSGQTNTDISFENKNGFEQITAKTGYTPIHNTETKLHTWFIKK